MKRISLVVLSLVLSLSAICQNRASFEKFWNVFQPLVVAQNFESLQAHTTFPLKAKGLLDSDKILKISKTNFAKAFSAYLDLEDLDDYPRTTTKYKNIIAMKKLPTSNKVYVSNGTARVDDMQFTYKDGKWTLTLIYDGHTE